MRKKIINTTVIRDYFTFSRSEQRGIFVLLTLIMMMLVFYNLIPVLVKVKTFDISASAAEISAFEKEIAAAENAEQMGKNSSGYYYYSSDKWRGYDTAKKTFREEQFVIELNSADTLELQRLRGIGPGFAKRIVKYRDKLGGFTEVSQVREVFGMDEERYQGIKSHLVVNPDSVHQIDINKVTFKGLMSHPYFPYEITRAVMIYRKDHKIFKNADELKNVPGINDSVFRRIVPYIRVSE